MGGTLGFILIQKEAKLSLRLIKRHAMKIYEGGKVQFQTFLISALDGSDRLNPEKNIPLSALSRRLESNSDTPQSNPYPSHYTDYVTPSHSYKITGKMMASYIPIFIFLYRRCKNNRF
jgi:hypothetical protein